MVDPLPDFDVNELMINEEFELCLDSDLAGDLEDVVRSAMNKMCKQLKSLSMLNELNQHKMQQRIMKMKSRSYWIENEDDMAADV